MNRQNQGWRRWIGLGLGCAAVALAAPLALAQQETAPAPEPAAAEKGERWIRVVEEDDGELIKLQIASREYRLADGAGPRVFLTGAVHVADESFYQGLQEFLDAKDVVLFEGVKPPGSGRLLHNAVADDGDALVKATKRRIRFVATFVEKYRHTHKEYPSSLTELAQGLDGRVEKILEGCTVDAWGNPLEFVIKDLQPVVGDQADPNHEVAPGARPKPRLGSSFFDIVSRGADGKPEGDGVDADLTFSEMPSIKREEIVEGEGIQRQLASALRLKFQLDAMDETKANWRNSDLSVDQVMDRLEESGADPDQLFSLVGGGTFIDAAVGMVAKIVGMSKSLSTMLKMGMVDMLVHADSLMEGLGGEMGKMMEVIIEDRNKVVIDDLAAVLRDEPDVRTIGIIYGAGHLPDLEKRLAEELRFEPVGEQWFTAITVRASDTGMSAKQVSSTRKMMQRQIQSQIKAMQRRK